MGQTDHDAPKISEEWRRKNARRIDLIHKKNRDGLTDEEMAEFKTLQQGLFAYLETLYPRPPLDLEKMEALARCLR